MIPDQNEQSLYPPAIFPGTEWTLDTVILFKALSRRYVSFLHLPFPGVRVAPGRPALPVYHLILEYQGNPSEIAESKDDL